MRKMFSKSRKTSISIVLSLFIIPILIITSITFVKPVYAQMMPMGMGMMPMGMGMMPMGMGMMPMGMGMMPMGMGMMPMGMGMMPMGMGMMPMGMGGGMMPMGGMGGGMMGGMGGGMMGGMGGGMMGGGMIPNIGGGMGGGIPGGGNPTSNFGNPGGPSGLPSLGGGDGGPLPQGQPCQPNAQNTVTAKDGTVWLSPTCTNQHIAQGCNVGQDSKPNPPYLTHLARGSSNDAVDFESPQGCGAPVYAPVDAVYTTINTAVGSTCQFSTSSGVYWLIHLKSVAGCNGPKRQGEIIGSNGCRGLEGMNGKGGPCHVHLSPPLPGAGYNPFCEIAKNPAPWIDQTDGCFYGGGTTTAGTGGTSGGSGGVGGGDENWRDIVSGAQGLMGQQKWAGGNGTDIFVRRGTQVRAPISGRVSFNSVPGGPMPIGEMIITNPDGRTVRFRHVQPIVSSGNVQLGQPVATVNDASMDMLRWPGGQYGNPPDGYQHLDLSLASNPGGLNPEGGQGGNVNAVQHIQSKGGIPNMQFVARTPGPPEGMSGGMMGGMMGGGMMPMGGGMMPMGGMMGGMPFGGI